MAQQPNFRPRHFSNRDANKAIEAARENATYGVILEKPPVAILANTPVFDAIRERLGKSGEQKIVVGNQTIKMIQVYTDQPAPAPVLTDERTPAMDANVTHGPTLRRLKTLENDA